MPVSSKHFKKRPARFSETPKRANHVMAPLKPRKSSNKRTQHQKLLGKKLAFIAAVVALILGGFLIFKFILFPQANAVKPGQEVTITIAEGEGGNAIANKLYKAGVVNDLSALTDQMKQKKIDSKLKIGTYTFVTGESVKDVINQLLSGPNSKATSLTISEGLSVAKCAGVVQQKFGISKQDFINQAKASNYVADYPFLKEAKDDSLEGFLYPKTYDFTDKTPTADSIIRAMLDQFKQEVSPLDFKAARERIKADYGIDMSDYDFLILASIIERETGSEQDFALVSSVFYNRLVKGMPLQSDATTAFVTGKDVTPADLKKPSPYNTYLNKGLPPTPICSPGIKTIKAAMNPDKTDYYYFLLIEKGNYSNHTFSKTYEEHQKAIEDAKKAMGE